MSTIEYNHEVLLALRATHRDAQAKSRAAWLAINHKAPVGERDYRAFNTALREIDAADYAYGHTALAMGENIF